jgi:hypothetical protein
MIMSNVSIAINDSVSSGISNITSTRVAAITTTSRSSNNKDDILSCTSSKISTTLNGLQTTVKYIRMVVSFSEYVSGQQARCVTELPLSFLLLFDEGVKP